MRTNRITIAVAILAATPAVCQQSTTTADPQEWRRLLKSTKAEQTEWINNHLSRGMPPNDTFVMLMLNKSDVTLPLVERKVEEVMAASTPSECFTDKSVDPVKFVGAAVLTLTEAGDVEGLRQVAKLIKIDEKRFGRLVGRTLDQARTYRNPFSVAYGGFEIGDPAIDSRIAAWAELTLSEKRPPLRSYGPRDPEPIPQSEIQRVRKWWAEAMVKKYGGVPTEAQWADDPIVSRLKPAKALHDTMIRAASDALQNGSKR